MECYNRNAPFLSDEQNCLLTCALTHEMILAIARYTTIRESVTQLLGRGGFNIFDCNEAVQGSGQNINLDKSPVPECLT